MFSSLKAKMIVPICGLLVLMTGFIVLNVSMSTKALSDRITQERIEGTTIASYEALRFLERQTRSVAVAIANNRTVVSNLLNWNAETDRAGSRQALISYLEAARAEMGVDSFVVRDAQGRVVLRLHDLNEYNDFDGSPAGAAALRGETTTSYSSTYTMPLGLNTTVPVRSEGEIIGTMTPLFFLHTEEFVDLYARLLNADVTVFAGKTRAASTVLNLAGERAVGSDADEIVIEKVLNQGEYFTTELMIYGQPYNANYFPLRSLSGNPVGMFFVGFSNAGTISANNELQLKLVIIGGVSLIVVAIIVFFLTMNVLKPIDLLTNALNEAAKGDLTRRLPEKGRDEISRASRSFNRTMETFNAMIAAIKHQSVLLSGIGSNLAANMTETAAAMNEIAANIQTIKGMILNQSASVTETKATMERVTFNIDKLNTHVENQTSAVSISSSTIEEMIANIQSVSSTLAKNANNVTELQKSANAGKSSLQEVVSDIKEIASESQGLSEINSVMENIASQTNLLSMNAAIEAAHAGESGKGFAVVAGEIRKLAESSSKQSMIIGDVLEKIKASIENITNSTDNALKKFETIDLMVKTVAQQDEVLRNAMEEQTQGSRQILQASGQVNEVTRQVKTDSVKMLEGSREVVEESRNLERATLEISNGMNEMSIGAEQVNNAVHAVNDLSSQTKESISSLVIAVSRFKV